MRAPMILSATKASRNILKQLVRKLEMPMPTVKAEVVWKLLPATPYSVSYRIPTEHP